MSNATLIALVGYAKRLVRNGSVRQGATSAIAGLVVGAIIEAFWPSNAS